MWGFLFLVTLSSCNYFHKPPSVYVKPKLAVGSKLCFIGDTGSGNQQQLDVAAALTKESCLEIHLLGDIIYNSGLKSVEDKNFEKKFLLPYSEILKTTPIFLSLGNHDYKGVTSVWYTKALKYKNIKFPSPYYHHVYGDLCLTTLDTNAFFVKQLIWLKKIYKEKDTCQFSIFTSHQPLVSSGAHGASPWIVRTFLSYALRSHTKLLISGHEHQLSDEGVINGVTQLITGAGGKLRPVINKPGVWGESIPGYLVVTVESISPYVLRYEFIGIAQGDRSMLHSKRVSL
jgi:hypothetical protein